MTGYWRHGTDLFVKCKISRQYFSSNFDKRFAIKLSEKVDTFYKRFAKVTFLAPTVTAATVCHFIVLKALSDSATPKSVTVIVSHSNFESNMVS